MARARRAARAAPAVSRASSQERHSTSSRRDQRVVGAALALSWVALYFGWRQFWFITDDAYISFRYVSNSVLGFGYVWNPPPFRPVEGYSNFLWVVLLDVAWRVLGLEPPAVSTWLSLLCSAATLAIVAWTTWELRWRDDLRTRRPVFLALVLLGVVSNRTFLAWSSSGLETALFNLFLSLWIWGALWQLPRTQGLLLTSAAAAGAALTRPDGLLFLAATLVLHGGAWVRGARSGPLKATLALAPFGLNVAHLLWRRSFYGAWLPNTYYAKHTGAWPESGFRYLASFVLEYALWIVALLALAVAVRRLRGGAPSPERDPMRTFVRVVALAALAAHVAYYTVIIGGDHFEYRVLSHLVPWLSVAMVWLVQRSGLPPSRALGMAVATVVLSWPVPWTHWVLTRDLRTREETHQLRMPVAPSWPPLVRGYAAAFDSLQSWLIGHYVGTRHQEHKAAAEWWVSEVLPPRAEGLRLSAEGYPVMVASGGIGGLGWMLPHVCLVDTYGLNDRVVAHTPPPPGRVRRMAHERVPPAGYVEGFRPNVTIVGPRDVRITPRPVALTADEILRWERTWWERLR